MRRRTVQSESAVIVLALTFHWLTLHGPDNVEITVNPQQIVSVREPRGPDRVVHKEAKCLLFLADGKFIAVTEDCATVRQQINAAGGED